jgi:O-antigen biosynthesis protein
MQIPYDPHYQRWMVERRLTGEAFGRQRAASRTLAFRPVISVLTPVFRTPPELLEPLLRSVRHQSYPFWEHCLVDDASREPWLAQALARAAHGDPRVRVQFRNQNGGISAATNDALALATGEFVAFLDHDDLLEPDALFAVASALNEHPDTDMLYSDYDLIGMDGRRGRPVFKPAWSPELLRTIHYMVHLTVYRRSVLQATGGFRTECDGAQDYDMALQVTERTDRIHHVPRVLYHWRVAPTSAAASLDAKPYAADASRRAMDGHVRRTDGGSREDGQSWGAHRVRPHLNGQPRVSVLLTTTRTFGFDTGLSSGGVRQQLTQCVSAVLAGTAYPQMEVLVANDAPPSDGHGATDELALQEILRGAGGPDQRVRLVTVRRSGDPAGPLDTGVALNRAAEAATGEHLLFVGDDLIALDQDWLLALLEISSSAAIGAVGPKILGSDNRIAHAGVVLPGGVPRRAFAGAERLDPGTALGLLMGICNYSAVSGACLMTRREVFDQAGGFTPSSAVGFPDIDYCLRVREAGFRVAFTAFAPLRLLVEAAEPESNEPDFASVAIRAAHERFERTWRGRFLADPYYNPNFDPSSGAFTLATRHPDAFA